jgi:hypothetical protein
VLLFVVTGAFTTLALFLPLLFDTDAAALSADFCSTVFAEDGAGASGVFEDGAASLNG